jgi:hypothetical protein
MASFRSLVSLSLRAILRETSLPEAATVLAALAQFGSFLLLSLDAGRLVVLPPSCFSQNARLLDQFAESPQGLLERLVRADDYFWQILPLPLAMDNEGTFLILFMS